MKASKLEVLMSCMHQNDTSLVSISNVQTDIVIVNQCDENAVREETYVNKKGEQHHIKFISTTQRGLSRSRNMAMRNSEADICLIADDDELLADNYGDIITEAFHKHPEADIISFGFMKGNKPWKQHKTKVQTLGYLSVLRISSVQIAFRRKSILEHGISFDEEMGAGTGHGAGEENKFLYDCLRKKLHIIYVPEFILTLSERTASTWFTGYNRQFFLQKGWETQRYMGKFMATLYAVYTAITKYPIYKKNCSILTAFKAMLTGIYRSNTLYQNQ